eukprot:2533253-Rhodomonas_salina.1
MRLFGLVSAMLGPASQSSPSRMTTTSSSSASASSSASTCRALSDSDPQSLLVSCDLIAQPRVWRSGVSC